MDKELEYDYIIVGQGIAGTVLHRKLTMSGEKCMVIDQGHETASSAVAAGLINPITGRKYVKSWMIEELLPVARKTYDELSQYLGHKVYKEVTIHRALYSVKDENIWAGRREDPLASTFIDDEGEVGVYRDTINGVLSYGTLKEGMQIHLPELITRYRQKLKEKGELTEERFDVNQLQISDRDITYKEIKAKAVIFAEGHEAKNNPLWQGLTFTPVKGEVLLVDIEGSPYTDVLRHKLFITPLPNGLYWVGSGYEWEYEDEKPTLHGRQKLEESLNDILTLPYEVVDHIAGVRPSVKDRKPFLGNHPEHDNVFIFNGMGTKGSSLSPYWAEVFVDYLQGKCELPKEVNIKFKYG